MNIIYLVKRPLSFRDASRYGIDYLGACGHSISAFDLSELFHPDIDNTRDPDAESWLHAKGIKINCVSDWPSLDGFADDWAKADLAIALFQSNHLTYESLRIFWRLRELQTPYLLVSPMVIPGRDMDDVDISVTRYFSDAVKRIRLCNPVNSVLSRCSREFLRCPPAAYYVRTGARSHRYTYFISESETNIIDAHSFDYDFFLKHQDLSDKDLNQAVFIDQNFPFHPDFLVLDGAPLPAKPYYDLLGRLFDRVEDLTGLKVIIAAHPRSDVATIPEFFKGRDVVFGPTPELIGQSRLVLAHNSTAINFPVMFRKPVALFITPEIYNRQVYEKYFYDGFSQALGTPLRDYSNVETCNLEGLFDINENKYLEYMKKFVKSSGTPKKPFWEIVNNRLVSTAMRT